MLFRVHPLPPLTPQEDPRLVAARAAALDAADAFNDQVNTMGEEIKASRSSATVRAHNCGTH
jgi:hypothetical protein